MASAAHATTTARASCEENLRCSTRTEDVSHTNTLGAQPVEPVKTVFEIGDVIADRYKVARILGRGGMGVVYLVEDRPTGEQLALKTLLPQYMADNYAVRRFAREVSAVRKLNHPSIVAIREARRTEHLLYYTMDYVDGKSLRKLMQQRRLLGLGSTVRVLALLAKALEHAHQYAVHRDISPENVMVLADGSIRLLDFGLAKLADNQGAFTQIGVSLGKHQYSAPEQLANAAGVDHRADLYSLGVMFFEMLTGKFPEVGDRVTDHVPTLPKECDAFAQKATALLPEGRFADAREFRRALMRVYQKSQAMQRPAADAAEKSEPKAKDRGTAAATPEHRPGAPEEMEAPDVLEAGVDEAALAAVTPIVGEDAEAIGLDELTPLAEDAYVVALVDSTPDDVPARSWAVRLWRALRPWGRRRGVEHQ